MTTTHASGLEARRWTRAEYDRMVEHGLLGPEDRVELVDGEILTLAPQYSPHSAMVMHAQKILEAAFGPAHHARVQMPFALDPMSEPEPDLAVVAGKPQDYLGGHPESAALLVEVAETTLAYDRRWKARLHARAGIPEYWIVNPPDRQLEIHRDPSPDQAARYGWSYASVERHDPSATVTPLAGPTARVAVADLLP